MSKFTVEEINFMCVFETQDRTDMIGQIRQVMPHIKDSDMEELGEQVLGNHKRYRGINRFANCIFTRGFRCYFRQRLRVDESNFTKLL